MKNDYGPVIHSSKSDSIELVDHFSCNSRIHPKGEVGESVGPAFLDGTGLKERIAPNIKGEEVDGLQFPLPEEWTTWCAGESPGSQRIRDSHRENFRRRCAKSNERPNEVGEGFVNPQSVRYRVGLDVGKYNAGYRKPKESSIVTELLQWHCGKEALLFAAPIGTFLTS